MIIENSFEEKSFVNLIGCISILLPFPVKPGLMEKEMQKEELNYSEKGYFTVSQPGHS